MPSILLPLATKKFNVELTNGYGLKVTIGYFQTITIG